MILSSAAAWEQIERLTFMAFSGVILTESVKQIYAAESTPINKHKRRYLPALERTQKLKFSTFF